MRANRLHAAIVGGGIGGLSAANALLKRGLRVSVLSRRQRSARSVLGCSSTRTACGATRKDGRLVQRSRESGPKSVMDQNTSRMDGTVVGPVLTTDSTRLEWPVWNAQS